VVRERVEKIRIGKLRIMEGAVAPYKFEDVHCSGDMVKYITKGLLPIVRAGTRAKG
jgi:hypothetical protein